MRGDLRCGRLINASKSSSPSSLEVALLFNTSTITFYDADCFALTRQYNVPATEGDAGLVTFDVDGGGKYLVAAGNNAMLYLYDLASDVLLLIAEMPPSAASVVQVEFSKAQQGEGTLFVLGDDGRILALDFTPTGCTVLYEVRGEESEEEGKAWSKALPRRLARRSEARTT